VRRTSDIVAQMVKQAIGDLDILAVDRDAVEWEVIPFVNPGASVCWLLGIGLPVPAVGDTIMPFVRLSDPHSREEVARTVQALYRTVAMQVLSVSGDATKAAEELRTSPGGLIVP
jgi:hypothetical protein